MEDLAPSRRRWHATRTFLRGGPVAIDDLCGIIESYHYGLEYYRTLADHHRSIYALAVLSDGRLVVAAFDGSPRIWDVHMQTCVQPFEYMFGIFAMAALPDGNLALGMENGTVRAMDTQNGRSLLTYLGHTGWVYALVALTDGRIASSSLDRTVRVWGSAHRERTLILVGHIAAVMGLTVLSNDRLASCSSDGVRVWDTTDGACLCTLEHPGPVRSIVALQAGRLVTGSQDGSLRVWDTATRTCVLQCGQPYQGVVRALALLPDGNLASGYNDQAICVWDVVTGVWHYTLEGHVAPVVSLVVLPNGQLASASLDTTVRIWG